MLTFSRGHKSMFTRNMIRLSVSKRNFSLIASRATRTTSRRAKSTLVLDGHSLTPDELCRLYVKDETTSKPRMRSELSGSSPEVKVSDSAWARVRASRDVVEEKLKLDEPIYGITTGFGALRNKHLDDTQLSELQLNLIRSHAAGVGTPLSPSRVKRLLAVRINIMAKGYSGIREETLRRMLDYLNKDCLPLVPERGSVGCSGDLAPSAHMALGLIGEGKMWNPSTREFEDAAKVAKEHGLEPITLSSKEGLALINGTQLQSSLLAEALVRSRDLSEQSDLVAGCTLEALRAVKDAFLPEVHEIRGQKGQIESARRIRMMMDTDGDPSELSRVSEKNVQDAYSIRCTPQVNGVVHDTIRSAWDVCTNELNAAVDNPLVLSDGRMVSAGNFHGEYPGKYADYLAIGVSELAAISERRIERMLNPSLSGPTIAVDSNKTKNEEDLDRLRRQSSINTNVVREATEHTYSLPAFLMPRGTGGLNSGFMIPHCTAAALVSENKVLCHPSTVDSISTSAAQEDHVSMGPWATVKLLRVVENVERVIGIELMAAMQALDLTGLKSTSKVESVKRMVREQVPFWERDQIANVGMDACFTMIREGRVLNAVRRCGVDVSRALETHRLAPAPRGDQQRFDAGTEVLQQFGKLKKKFMKKIASLESTLMLEYRMINTGTLELALYNATLVTMTGSTSPGRFGDFMTCKIGKDAMNDVGLKQDHGVVVDSNGVITFVGSTDEVKSYVAEKGGAKREIDCDGRAVVPGLVDSHTHAVHSGDRSLELAAKLSGESYTSITSRGGGIHFTVAETRKASLPELENALRARLRAMIMEGTTTVEIKSGYGLDTETEIKMLRAIHNVSRDMPIKIVTTFLGAHAVPRDMDPDKACDIVCYEMLPRLEETQRSGVTSVSLIDAFCEDGFFTPEHTRKISEEGYRRLGLLANFHGDELSDQNSGTLAAACSNAIAVSHLEHVNENSIRDMASNKIIGVALPSTAFLLRLNPPPVRDLIEQNVPVALASDYNPNCPVMSMPLVMNQACVMMGMTMEEALVASTINSAASIAVSDEVGTIEVGKRGDMLLLSTDAWQNLVYLGMGAMRCSPIGSGLGGVGGRNEVTPLINEVLVGGRCLVRDGHFLDIDSTALVSSNAGNMVRGSIDAVPSPEYAFLSQGLVLSDDTLPSHDTENERDPSVPHAPKRPINPTLEEKRLAIRNALRYFPHQFHAELGKEFMRELDLYGHIYMYRFRPEKRLRAWNSRALPAKTEQTRAIMHQILNNLDPDVAQFPHELVTYGGTGSVFQNWAQFRLVMKYLSEMTDEQTLVMYSGHPLGVFPSHKDAPRVVVTNGLTVPNYSSNSDYERYYMLGVSQYGQMTAGSYCYVGPQGIVHGTTITVMGAARLLGKETCDRLVFVTAGLGGMSGAQAKASNIVGCIGVVAEINEDALKKRHEQGWLTEWTDDLDEVMNSIRKYRSEDVDPVGVSIGYLGNVVDLWERLAQEDDIPVHLGSDQTSCHLVHGGGYYPQGLTYEEANELMASDNEAFKERVNESLVRHVNAVNEVVKRKNTYFWDYGNSFMLNAGRAGADIFAEDGVSFRYPSYVEDIMGDVFSLGFGPFRWICTSGKEEDLALTDSLAEMVMNRHLEDCESKEHEDEQARAAKGCFRDNLKWIREAGSNQLVVGSQARILYADAKSRIEIALELNQAVRDGRLSGPVAISRDHHDVSGVDSPWRETSNITDGSRFCADMAVQNFVGDAFRGASVVALHNGGGTGFGEAINGGFVLVLDGTEDASRRASMMLHWDVFNGVCRRAWDGNDNANLTVTSEENKIPDLTVTRIHDADEELLSSLVE